MTNMILGITMYPLLFLFYFLIRWVVKAENGYCFGASLKKEWRKELEIEAIRKKFQKSLDLWLLVAAVVPAVTFFIPYVSIVFTIWMVWLLCVCVYPAVPFVSANHRVRQWKQEKGYVTREDGVTYTELKQAGEVRSVKHFPFLVPVLASLAAVPVSAYLLWKEDLLYFTGTLAVIAACTPLFYLCAWITDRQKTEVISTDSEVNVNYARARKKIWKDLWLQASWLNAVFTWLFAAAFCLFRQGVWFMIGGVIVYGVVFVLVIILCFIKFFRLDRRYEDKRDLSEPDDSDRYWIGGLFYFNPNDRHIMVNQRTGIGTTMNMASPVSIVIDVIAGLLLLMIPVICVWMILEEFVPIHLKIEEQAVVAEHLDVDYRIPLSDITEVLVLEEEPEWTKINGMGMDNLSKGTFEIYHEGKCEAFLNPQNTMFLKIVTDDNIYYFSGYDDKETEDIYDCIVNEKMDI